MYWGGDALHWTRLHQWPTSRLHTLWKVGGIDVLLISDNGFDGWKCLGDNNGVKWSLKAINES
jgi:hypothetical protein